MQEQLRTYNDVFNPKVSIIIPVYNGSNYLREAIDSALAQTHKNVEVIVVNDGSTDGGGTETIAKSYGNRIRYIFKENGGVASALNAGIREMTGEYFSWLSHDDIYFPHKLETQVNFLKTSGKETILYSDYEFIDAHGRFLGVNRVPSVSPAAFRRALIVSDPVNGCTLLIPRICFEKTGLFNEELRSIQDYDMWFRLAREFPFVHVPEVLLKSRKHPGQGTHTISSHFQECSTSFIRFIRELTTDEINKMTDEPLSIFYLKLAIRMKLRGYPEAGDVALSLSVQHADQQPLRSSVQRFFLAVFYKVLNKKCKPGYWFSTFKK